MMETAILIIVIIMWVRLEIYAFATSQSLELLGQYFQDKGE